MHVSLIFSFTQASIFCVCHAIYTNNKINLLIYHMLKKNLESLQTFFSNLLVNVVLIIFDKSYKKL